MLSDTSYIKYLILMNNAFIYLIMVHNNLDVFQITTKNAETMREIIGSDSTALDYTKLTM